MEFLKKRYRNGLKRAIEYRWITMGVGLASLAVALFLTFSGVIGSEFLPHLDEGAIWARGEMANSVGETEGTRFAQQSRHILASFPEVTRSSRKPARPTMEPTREDSQHGILRRLEAQGPMATCLSSE